MLIYKQGLYFRPPPSSLLLLYARACAHTHKYLYVSTNVTRVSLHRMAQYQEDTKDAVLVKAEKLEKGGWEDYPKT